MRASLEASHEARFGGVYRRGAGVRLDPLDLNPDTASRGRTLLPLRGVRLPSLLHKLCAVDVDRDEHVGGWLFVNPLSLNSPKLG